MYKRSIIAGVLSLGLLAGCTKRQPEPDYVYPASGPMVYEGQYILDADIAALWCGHLDDCQEEVSGVTYAISQVDSFAIIRKEGESKIVPYRASEDLCLTQGLGPGCEPNYVVYAQRLPSDPMLRELWGMANIKAPSVWKNKTTTEALVAVIDSGVDCRHPDLNCVKQYDAITNKEEQEDQNGHGTHVAGTIGARHDAVGVAGVASGVSLLAVKFLGANGSGALSDAIRAVNWAVDNGADIINASWGCRGCFSQAMHQAIKRAGDAGVLFIAAAGNSGVSNDASPHYPSDYELDNVVSVGAISQANKLASFSNYGESVDAVAPGTGILSTAPGGGYQRLSGTSMATPHIAGGVALLWPNIRTKRQLVEYLRDYTPTRGRTTGGGAFTLQKAKGSTKRCKEGRLRTCYQGCRSSYECRYHKQRKCRAVCLLDWCPERDVN